MKCLVLLVSSLVFMVNLGLYQCSGSNTLTTKGFPNTTPIKHDFPNVVSFDYSSTEQEYIFKSGKPVTLNNSEISDTLDILNKAAIELNSKAKKERSVADIHNYNLQLLSILNEENQKVVWVNALCRNSNPDVAQWKKSIIIVSDGGNCYFNLYINLTKKTYENFIVNGEA